MLASEFVDELARAAPETPVTGVLSWHLDVLQGQAGDELMSRLAELKQPVLGRLGMIPGMCINPLPGMPHAIAMAPAQRWREFLRDLSWLADSPDIDIAANRAVFHAHGASATSTV